MSTYCPLYTSAPSVIDDDDEKFLKRNREERKEEKYCSHLTKSSSLYQTGTYIYIFNADRERRHFYITVR
jgi:hypothetical protein